MNKYRVIYQEQGKNKKINISHNELESFVKNKNIVSIKENKKVFSFKTIRGVKKSEVLDLFSQLEMILQADITFYEAVKIVLKATKNPILMELLESMKSALKSGKPIYTSFKGYEKYLDKIIISFFEISHMKGNTVLIVSSLCKVLNLKKNNKALILSSLSYPLLIFISFMIALSIIFVAVIPKFEHIFIQYNLQLPTYTTWLLSFKALLVDYFFLIFSIIVSAMLCIKMAYQNVSFRYRYDKTMMTRIPIISKLYTLFELYNIFICMNVLMKSKYEFNVALENSALLLKNKYLLDKIDNISRSVKNGCAIYDSFEKAELFDEVVLNLLNSGEKSSNMEDALQRVEEYYKQKFTKKIKQFASLIEPLFFAVMMLLILWVMLAIFTPIWNMSEMLNL